MTLPGIYGARAVTCTVAAQACNIPHAGRVKISRTFRYRNVTFRKSSRYGRLVPWF
jgi:hypothetical protein